MRPQGEVPTISGLRDDAPPPARRTCVPPGLRRNTRDPAVDAVVNPIERKQDAELGLTTLLADRIHAP